MNREHRSAAAHPPTGFLLSRGLWMMVGSSFGFALMASLVKAIGTRIPTFEVVWFRAVVSLGLTLLLIRGARASAWGRRRGWLALRGLAGFLALLAYFRTLTLLPLAVAQVLQYTSPAFSALLAPAFLGERASRRTWGAIGLAFLGLCLIARPRAAVPPLAAAIALAGAFGSAVAYNIVRKLRDEHPFTIILYLPLVSFLLASPPTAAAFVLPRGLEWWLLLGVGLTSQVAQILLTYGLHAEAVARGSTATYLNVVFAGVLGWAIWSEVPDRWSWAGAALVTLAVLSLGRREEPAAEEPLRA
jgi:drug/metabolite transporter (DMT)-like permease